MRDGGKVDPPAWARGRVGYWSLALGSLLDGADYLRNLRTWKEGLCLRIAEARP